MTKQTRWYIRRGELVKGPYLSAVVKQNFLLGRILEDDEVSDDQANWRSMSECKFLHPDILLDENTSEHEIHEAQIRADERGVDRRGEAKSKMEAERREARDRRQGEEEDMVEYRERHVRVMDSLRERNPTQKSNRGFIYLSVVSIMVVGLAYVFTPRDELSEAQCNARAQPGVNWSNCSLPGVDHANSDLENANLKSAKLDRANFFGSNLSGADLAYAELSLAVLGNAELVGANFKGADLSNTDLSYANFSNANLSYADLSNANIGGAVFSNTRFDNAIWVDGRVCGKSSVGVCLSN